MFRNLLYVAAADGRISESELRLLADRATEWGITDDEFEAVLQDAINGKGDLTIPTEEDERRAVLQEMLRMMAADGALAESEKRMFAILCAAIGCDDQDINVMIDAVLSEEAEEGDAAS